MPHECTNCERVFADGSKEMLSGCPNCGGNKFQFRPESATETPTLDDDGPTLGDSPPADEAPSSRDKAPSSRDDAPTTGDDPQRTPADSSSPPGDSSPTSDAPSAPDGATTSRSASTDTGGDFIVAESDPSAVDETEDTAQADARRDVVSRDELDGAAPPPQADDAARAIPPDDSDSPGIEDLRQELNDQFESIKILEPGQYELNLMELYDRQECIISLQEDGHYVIEVADAWRDDG